MTEAEIFQFYPSEPQLREELETHSRMVAGMALEIAEALPELNVNRQFIYEAAMLHDIGITYCYAPDIHCNGNKPYLLHGTIGSEILKKADLPAHALVCERHTGSGLTEEEIISRGLPLPHHDMLPITEEEKIICYADKFYSKSGVLTQRKSLSSVIKGMARHGHRPLERFLRLHQRYGGYKKC